MGLTKVTNILTWESQIHFNIFNIVETVQLVINIFFFIEIFCSLAKDFLGLVQSVYTIAFYGEIIWNIKFILQLSQDVYVGAYTIKKIAVLC